MTTEHPITPSPELVRQWTSNFYGAATVPGEASFFIATQAARWGADQELEACCEWFRSRGYHPKVYRDLLAARRKPPSLKEQALEAVAAIKGMADDYKQFDQDIDTIRRALEALPDD